MQRVELTIAIVAILYAVSGGIAKQWAIIAFINVSQDLTCVSADDRSPWLGGCVPEIFTERITDVRCSSSHRL